MDAWQILRGRWSVRQRAYANLGPTEVATFRAGVDDVCLNTARTDVVRFYLDTYNRQALEGLVETAADELSVANAQVNVITADEQITLAYVGSSGSCPREDGWCQNVVGLGEALAVVDSAHHRLVMDHPAIASTVSYLGAPITLEGQVIGTFCVFADSVRGWTEKECRRLGMLARLASEARF